MSHFVRGFAIPFRGMFIVFSSFRLFLLAVLPFWLCLFGFIYTLWLVWNSTFTIVPYLMDWVPGLYNFTEKLKIGEFSLVAAIVQGTFWFFLLIFASYFSYIVLCIVGAPFYALMADRILLRHGVSVQVQNNFLRWLYTLVRMLIVSIIKIVFFLGLSLILFVISFFTIGMFLVPLCLSLMMSYDCMDFSFECVTMSLKERLRYFLDHLSLFMGLALAILVIGVVPGLFTIMLPFFIAGGAAAFSDIHKAEKNKLVLERV